MGSFPRILVVDDTSQTLTALAGHYTLIPAAGPSAGLRLFGRTPPDLVVLSTALGGGQLCAKLRAASNVPIIILTDARETFDVIQAFELGADEFLTRPVPADLLRARIDSLLRRSPANTRKLPASTVWLAGRVYRAVQADDRGETRFSLTNDDGFFFVRTMIKDLCLQENERIVAIGCLRSSFDRRCRGHHGWLQAERILPLSQAEAMWRREGTLEVLLTQPQP